ncbi:hypothetical protein BGX28_003794 [Mortierella sp. GBA30]|nr:hypothetical protein BGX28_003794 [Mortierella sp. GBA30]
MSLSLRINPIEIPELLHVIGRHLSINDQKTCMLVSKTWLTLFRAYYWHHLYYICQDLPYLEQYGHLVRRLTTYGLSDKEVFRLAGSCHMVQRLELGYTSNRAVEVIVSNMPHISDLTVRATTQHSLCAITRLKGLRHLTLSPEPRTAQMMYYEVPVLLNILQECPSLSSLKIHSLTWKEHKSKTTTTTPQPAVHGHVHNDIDYDYIDRTFRGWCRRVFTPTSIRNFTPPPRRPPPAPKEPWRKFSPDHETPFPTSLSDEQRFFQTPNLSEIYPRLTRLELINTWMELVGTEGFGVGSPVGLLFVKARNLKELHMDFRGLSGPRISECLDAITDNCFQLQSLTMDRLESTYEIRTSIENFFRKNRPGLQNLRLERGVDLEFVLDLIPDPTAHGLERLRLVDTIFTHSALHRFMARCWSLQALRWTVFSRSDRIFRADERLSAFREPWPCCSSMRVMEHNYNAVDQDSFEAFFQRAALMDRLVSLSIHLDDIRRSVANASLSSAGCLVSMGRQGDDDDGDRDKEVEEMKGWYFEFVQELTFLVGYPAGYDSRITRQDPRQLNVEEVRYVLRAFPRLKKIRYERTHFPLDDDARDYLAKNVDRSISVMHVSQLPNSVL